MPELNRRKFLIASAGVGAAGLLSSACSVSWPQMMKEAQQRPLTEGSGVLVILTMYGGGFATIPAYLRDLFGMSEVGAIHGALLTAWSVAGVAGPVLINYIRQYQIDHGVAKAGAYWTTMYVMASLLVVGLICNLLIRPVHERHHIESQTVAS